MASIQAGIYTVSEFFDAVGFNFAEKSAADYLDGQPDYRRVKIGGIGFDDLEKVFEIPYTTNSLDITVDGKVDETVTVTLTDEQREWRARSFESAADANDTN